MNGKRSGGMVDEVKVAAEKEIEAAKRIEREKKKAEERKQIAQKKKESSGGYPMVNYGKSNSRIAVLEGSCELCGIEGPITATNDGDFCVKCLSKVGVN